MDKLEAKQQLYKDLRSLSQNTNEQDEHDFVEENVELYRLIGILR